METMGDDHDIAALLTTGTVTRASSNRTSRSFETTTRSPNGFASKHEAFEAGFSLGQQEAPRSMAPDR
jgi:hypothetical protein